MTGLRRRLGAVSMVAVAAAALVFGKSAAPTAASAEVPPTFDVGHQVTCTPLADVPPALESRLKGQICSHGGDSPPPASQRRAAPSQSAAFGPNDPTPGIECYGDGQAGPRVQAIYARPADVADRYGTVAPIIEGYAAVMESEVAASAALTAGVRHIRWATTATASGCKLEILNIEVAADGDGDFRTKTVPQLIDRGLLRGDRAYMVWMDSPSNLYCGVGSLYRDDTQSVENFNYFGPSWSRVDPACWGVAETHELGHNLGAVQNSAPNSNGAGHCRDEFDLMCYSGAGGLPIYPTGDPKRCTNAVLDRRWDCNNDDYFHTNPPPGNYLATHWNVAFSPFLAQGPSTTAAADGGFRSITPERIFDSRSGARISGGSEFPVHVTGTQRVPPVGVSAVALNVTVTDALGPGYVSLYSFDAPTRPLVSNLNYVPGPPLANSATVTVPFDGLVNVYAHGNSAHVVLDVVGWYADASGYEMQPGGYHPLAPSRIVDTRLGQGGTRMGPASTLALPIHGSAGVPADAAAVVLNITSTAASAASFITVWPSDAAQPTTSNLNPFPGRNIPNQVVSKIGADGTIRIFNAFGNGDLVVDVMGWYDSGVGSPGARFHALEPRRVFDTRITSGPAFGPAETRQLPLTGGVSGVPSGAVAVAANVTVTNPSVGGFLTFWPNGPKPQTSAVNFGRLETTANLGTFALGGDATNVFNYAGSTDVIVDVAGWFG